MRVRHIIGALLVAILLTRPASAQIPEARPSPLPDDRLKADILVVIAHPDDEILIIGYLARAILDEHKRVAVVYATRGDHGANRIGYEQAASLALEREMESRRGLAALGVLSVWFWDAPNVAEPTEDPLGSLEKWSHGEVLERTVRLIRLTRPEVVITWLPDYVVGENHCDHQASGILATEAFDLAGNPLVFPEQVTPPLDYRGYGNLKEGLHP
jgi:LmbE family N-acetylglucosaminyl deacetylase